MRIEQLANYQLSFAELIRFAIEVFFQIIDFSRTWEILWTWNLIKKIKFEK